MTYFVKKAKLTESKNKIPDISDLATKTALTAAENKIPDVSTLVKKTDYNTKDTEIENKLTDHNHDTLDTQEFNKLAAGVFNVRTAQAKSITKTEVDPKLPILHRKITQNKTKYLLVENEFNKLKTFDLFKSHRQESF